MELSQAVAMRKSVRNYTGEQVSNEQIRKLLEAAMLAPSACNMRPVEFVVVKNKGKLEEIMAIHPYASMLKTAGCAIIVVADVNKQNDVARGMYVQDCSAAIENILLKAVDLGLGTCWCGVSPNKVMQAQISKIFDFEKNIEPFAIIAVGYPGEESGSRGFYEEDKVTWVE
jgi:nitroreductase